ncbi:ATP-grasp domain-containing protein [Desulfoscipio sp. XC116]|uniref:ATP-grasp domain-containing protein n=1 Tax=Desulfoscipio sp. XC116 TaxID=3144975 RepID=UPI00325A9C04
MKLLIYEYFSSGARENQDLKQAGFAMLDAILKDFVEIPELHLMTVLDVSLREAFVRASYSQKVDVCWSSGSKDGTRQYEKTLMACRAVLIIAPEIAGILAELTAIAERWGKIVLGSNSHALKIVCHKSDMLDLMKKKGLPVPKSQTYSKPFPQNMQAEILDCLSFPFVIKPVYGAGGEGVRLIETGDRLDKAIEQLSRMEEEIFLFQEYIPGQAVSVSCFVLGGKALPLSLNRQNIKIQGEFVFQGITIPFVHAEAGEIMKTAVKACEVVQGLKGFVGVDLVVNTRGPVLMEINARPTMAYVALREVVSRNLVGDLLALGLENSLPEKPEVRGTYTYSLQLA